MQGFVIVQSEYSSSFLELLVFSTADEARAWHNRWWKELFNNGYISEVCSYPITGDRFLEDYEIVVEPDEEEEEL